MDPFYKLLFSLILVLFIFGFIFVAKFKIFFKLGNTQ